jgi:hypothetical protein
MIFNLRAIPILLVSFGLEEILGFSDYITLVLLVVLDLSLRACYAKQFPNWEELISPDMGGHVFWIPIWSWGFILAIIRLFFPEAY